MKLLAAREMLAEMFGLTPRQADALAAILAAKGALERREGMPNETTG